MIRGDAPRHPRCEPQEGALLRARGQPGQVPLAPRETPRLASCRSWSWLTPPVTREGGRRAARSHRRGPREFQGICRAAKALSTCEIQSVRDRASRDSRVRPVPPRRPATARLPGRRRSSTCPRRRSTCWPSSPASAGQVVPKEELLRRVWPDTFVEEANLSVNVSILRKALGDQPDGQPWIQTVPRRGYRFLGAVRAPAAAPRSLAVLPFRSLGGDEADHALGLGMADALITRLAATGRVAVRPTGTVRRFAEADIDPVAAGRQLEVDAVLDGRLQRAGTRLRLTLQLVPTGGGPPLWADRFDEEFTHLFAVEDAVAERVASALVAELTRGGAAAAGPAADGEPRGLPGLLPRPLLLGPLLAALGREGDAVLLRGRRPRPPLRASPRRPRRRVPRGRLRGGAPAGRGLGPRRGAVAPGARPRRRDPRAARLRRLPAPLPGLGLGRRRARAAPRRRAGPGVDGPSPVARPRCWTCGDGGTRRRRVLRRAEALDPLSTVVSALVGLHHAFGGDHEGELAHARRTLELDPHQLLGHWAVGGALQNLGRYEEAVGEHRRALDLAEGSGFMRPVLARSLALAGRADEARALVAAERAGRGVALPDGHGAPRPGRDGARPRAPGPGRGPSATRGS